MTQERQKKLQCHSNHSETMNSSIILRYLINRLGRILKFVFGSQLQLYSLDPDHLLNSVAPNIFKENQNSPNRDIEELWREGFNLLTKGWNESPLGHKKNNPSLYGRYLLYKNYTGLLGLRKSLKQDQENTPGLTEVPIQRPIFIVGWLRTGSTLLQNLLAQDPLAKAPLLWELWSVSPIPNSSDAKFCNEMANVILSLTVSVQNLIENHLFSQKVQQDLQLWLDLEPSLIKMHEMNARKPDECCHLFEHQFIDRHSPVICPNMEPYRSWLLSITEEEAIKIYQEYKKELQAIAFDQWRSGKLSKDYHFVLKDAQHMFFLNSLIKVFPDCIVIATHRDPLEVVPSTCSGFKVISHYYYDYEDINLNDLGKRVLDFLSDSSKKMISSRISIGPDLESKHIIDLRYSEFIRDPITWIKNFYSKFNLPFSPEFQNNMEKYLKENPKDKYGKHVYSLNEYNITVEQVQTLFRDYTEKYL